METEKSIEKYLVQKVKEKGGICLKLESNYRVGLPDRLCLFPGGRGVFIELKSPGKKPSPRQQYYLGLLSKLGFTALWLDSKQEVDKVINEKGATT